LFKKQQTIALLFVVIHIITGNFNSTENVLKVGTPKHSRLWNWTGD